MTARTEDVTVPTTCGRETVTRLDERPLSRDELADRRVRQRLRHPGPLVVVVVVVGGAGGGGGGGGVG